jgi:hypothetical protein
MEIFTKMEKRMAREIVAFGTLQGGDIRPVAYNRGEGWRFGLFGKNHKHGWWVEVIDLLTGEWNWAGGVDQICPHCLEAETTTALFCEECGMDV